MITLYIVIGLIVGYFRFPSFKEFYMKETNNSPPFGAPVIPFLILVFLWPMVLLSFVLDNTLGKLFDKII